MVGTSHMLSEMSLYNFTTGMLTLLFGALTSILTVELVLLLDCLYTTNGLTQNQGEGWLAYTS